MSANPRRADKAQTRESHPADDTTPNHLLPTLQHADELAPPTEAIPLREMMGKYELRRALGRGGMGAVYLAFDPLIEREVAIKVLRPDLAQNRDYLERFLGEARAAGRINHPNAIAIYEIGEEAGEYFIVMEFAPGGSVQELLRTSAVTLPEACRIVIEAARGLSAAHELGLIHRDVKPENLMLNADGVVKIVDFGLSKNLDCNSENALTQAGQVLGSPFYMSPEQIKCAALDARTDIYSLGATFYQLVTGETPFTGESIAQLLYSHMEAQRPDPLEANPELPAACSDIVRKAMAVDPEDRYASLADFIADVETLLPTVGQPDVGLPREVQATAPLSRHPRILVVEPSNLTAKVVADMFRQEGYDDVVRVESAAEGLRRAKSDKPDIVITSRQLKDSSGESLLRQIRQTPGMTECLCVLMSSDSPHKLMSQSTIGGPLAFTLKQSPVELVRAVRCCTNFKSPNLPKTPTATKKKKIAVVVQEGQIPTDLAGWLQEQANCEVAAIPSDQMAHATTPNTSNLIICLDPEASRGTDLHRCFYGPLGQMVGDHSTLAVVDPTGRSLRLRGIKRQDCAVVCDCLLDRDRVLQLLAAA